MNAGRSAYCFIEALEYKRKLIRKEVMENVVNLDVMISEEVIHDTVMRLAEEINLAYKDKSIHMIGLLKGSFVFMADLVRHITVPVTIDFMSVTSYEGEKSSGEIKILKELNESIYNKDVIVVEDIIDTGITITSILELLKTKNPKSIEVVTLLDKPSRRVKPFSTKYTGIEIEDRFVVGYGIDYNQQYRQLPYIGVVKSD
jgi:hypoxanthine phosphoribosyltransferase